MGFLEIFVLIVFAVTGTAVSIAALVHHAVTADAAARRRDSRRAEVAPAPLAKRPGRNATAG